MVDNGNRQRKIMKANVGCVSCCLHGHQCAASSISNPRRERQRLANTSESHKFTQVAKYLVERDSPDNSAVSVNSKPSKPSGLRGNGRRDVRKYDEDEEDTSKKSSSSNDEITKTLSEGRSKRENKCKLQHSQSFTEVRYKPLNAMVKSTDDSNDGSEESKHGKSELILGFSPSSVDPKSTCPLKRYYIGIVTRKTSEMFVWRNTAFRVYHEFNEKDSINNELPLYIVYRNSRGEYFHYPIKERFDEIVHAVLLHVEYGDDRSPEFMRLGALIKYYSIYASLHSYSHNKGLTADVFPWWLQTNAERSE